MQRQQEQQSIVLMSIGHSIRYATAHTVLARKQACCTSWMQLELHGADALAPHFRLAH